MGMRVDIVTLFPEMCQQVLDAASLAGRQSAATLRPTATRSGITP